MNRRKILFLAANPTDSTRLQLGKEVRDISEGLRRSKHRNNFKLVERWEVRSRDLLRAMLEELPQIVHFSGHGGEDGIFLVDGEGRGQLIKRDALVELFQLFSQNSNIECVLLNGCYSEAQARAISEFVPFVIGMRQAVGDSAAVEFAVGFYDALSAGRSVSFAFKSGRVAMSLAGTGYGEEPILLQGKNLSGKYSKNRDTIVDSSSLNVHQYSEPNLSVPNVQKVNERRVFRERQESVKSRDFNKALNRKNYSSPARVLRNSKQSDSWPDTNQLVHLVPFILEKTYGFQIVVLAVWIVASLLLTRVNRLEDLPYLFISYGAIAGTITGFLEGVSLKRIVQSTKKEEILLKYPLIGFVVGMLICSVIGNLASTNLVNGTEILVGLISGVMAILVSLLLISRFNRKP